MKAKKTMVLLYCLEKLLTEHKFSKEEVMSEFDLSKPAFDRYKKDLRDYLTRYHPDWALKYKRRTDIYYVANDE